MAKKIINVTDIISYLYCPRKVYLKLIKNVREPATKVMISGFLKHKIFDIFNKNEPAIVSGINQDLSKEQIAELYKQHLEKITKETAGTYSNMVKGFGINADDLLADAVKQLKKDISLRADAIKTILPGFKGKELWRNLKPKFLTEFEIVSEELGLKGRIDRVKLEQGIVPYELKTREEIYDSDKLQLAAYSLLLEKEFGKKIEKGIIETKKKQEEITITEEMKNEVLEIAEKIRNFDKEPEFQSNFSKCRNCRLKEDCFEG